ncbi:TrmH family RNA methyltransferase [Armatimonas rosea]|uniref:TrmH family RNA methyltransferase n=1 Tax=Armatimonas rosea TaxID=685828 RepID=A0A7W9SNK1_ARMRO|nr:RNA methyltransferase [Armatimonas rosea]MBB6049912.1 TrmH family RNA methyltransferase [Armatimonas rosea]
MNLKHPAFEAAERLLKPQGRRETGSYLVEDRHLVRQALEAPQATVEAAYCVASEVPALEPLCVARGIPLYVLTGGLLQKLTGTGYETSVTAVAIVKQHIVKPAELLSEGALVLCGERIQDPRNVGVLIRTAEAIGCTGLLLSAGSAEPFSRQAVRSTTGSILRLPLALAGDLPKTLALLREQGATVVASSGAATQTAAQATLSVRPLVLVMGNEQEGISDEVAAASDRVVRLPMAPSTGADSYNVTVAAGMLLYEAIRRDHMV